jgi:hypothetical protein
VWPCWADESAALCSDRAAIERVYYQHRLGDKPPFEQALLRETIERLVRDDLRKEAVLKRTYGVEVTSAMLDAEVQRINATTRAPEMLAELKAALGNDTNRFARIIAQPIVVERLLRERFNDDALHAAQRREAERVRAELLAVKQGAVPREGEGGRRLGEGDSVAGTLVEKLLAVLKQSHSNDVSETTWLLETRPAAKPSADGSDELEIRQRFGPNAQPLSPPHGSGKARKFYFEDLPAELQRVLHAQLRQPGDVSAVIEAPGSFLVYVCKEKNGEVLSVATLCLSKRSYEQWVAEQNGGEQ